jgi:hypothetical protein
LGLLLYCVLHLSSHHYFHDRQYIVYKEDKNNL